MPESHQLQDVLVLLSMIQTPILALVLWILNDIRGRVSRLEEWTLTGARKE